MKRALLTVVVAGACSSGHSVATQTPDGAVAGPDAQTVDPNKDSDHDGVPDLIDNCPHMPNPDQRDHDGDGRGDVCDVCPHLPDTGGDADGDGVGDACDPHPTTPGDRIAFFEGFYGADGWTQVEGTSSWQFDGMTAHQADTSSSNQLVTPTMSNTSNLFIEARVRVNAFAHGGQRATAGLVAGYQSIDDTYFFCGFATTGNATEVDSGYAGIDSWDSGYNRSVFPADMTGDWMILQATSTAEPSGAVGFGCLGHRGSANADTSYTAYSDTGGGQIGVRTNGSDASFDYVFAVEMPPTVMGQ